jgi:hypothetical protein
LPAAFGDQPHGGSAHEILFVKTLAPNQQCDVKVFALQLVPDEPREFPQRRADVRISPVIEQQLSANLL